MMPTTIGEKIKIECTAGNMQWTMRRCAFTSIWSTMTPKWLPLWLHSSSVLRCLSFGLVRCRANDDSLCFMLPLPSNEILPSPCSYCHRHAATAIAMQLLLSTCSYCHRHAKTCCSVLDVLDRTENSEVEDFSLALIIVPQGRCFWGSTLEFPPVDFAVVVGVQPFWKKYSKDL